MAAADLKQLGRYDLTRVLGKGAMGIVYEGMDPKLHRKVAIKTILKGHLDDEAASKEYSMRFMREAQAVARLNHANIVQVYDFGEEGDIAYIVMEFIKGKELKSFFDANERFDLKESVRIMCELCDALDFAHEGGIVHRDIKPANVMLDSQAKVKLADFGVARVTDADRTQVEKTQAGTMVGTPAYMSPEQITGGNIDRRTDVFSAGIILYQFLTGEKPFTGSGAWTIAKKIIQDHPPLPSSINNTISPLFDHVVNKALSKQVETRYQTAKELGAALKRALEGKADEDDSDKTVFTPGGMAAMPSLSPQAAVAKADATKSGSTGSGSQEVELEFWRAIKDGNDPDDFELYVQQFPSGIYAALAKRKIAKLKGVAPEESGAKAKEQEKREAEEAAKREAEVKQKLADEKAKLEATLAQREAEYKKREAEAAAKAEAEAKARREEMEKARAEAETARKEAEALAAKREADAKARYEAEMARREAESKARQEAEEKERAKRDAEARAKADAEAKARREEMERTKAEAAKARAEAEARAKKEAEERAKQQAEAAKREADLKKKLAEAPKAKMPVAPIIAAIVAIAIVGGGAYYYLTAEQRAKQAALTARLEDAAKASEELNKAKQAEVEAQKKLAEARAAELEAIKRGDTAKVKELEEARKRAEAEAAKQADAVKQREAAATKAREDAKKAQDAAKSAKADKATDKTTTVTTAPVEPVKPAAPVKPQPVAVAPVTPTPKVEPVAPKVEPKREPKTRSEREAERDAQLAREVLQKKGVTPSAEPTSTPGPVAMVTPTPGAPAAPSAPTAPAKPAVSENETLYQQAQSLEAGGQATNAVRLYRRAARAGHGKSAKRLGDIYDRGVPGVSRDYAESLQWYQTARDLGETVETAGKR
jgi:serine/threonine protein kinase